MGKENEAKEIFSFLLFGGQKVEQKAQATENYCLHS